jgi:hypothetical protein
MTLDPSANVTWDGVNACPLWRLETLNLKQ